MYDLIIIGGGPAGCTSAITAARRGARVLLLEKGRFPRHKVCGEFVSSESLALLSSLLGGSQVLKSALVIGRARTFGGGRPVEFAVKPPAASITRFDLDQALWRVAESTGVDARQQTSVSGVSGDGPLQVATSAGEFEGRALIDCSGRWSSLSARQSSGNGEAKWIGLKAHFKAPIEKPSVDLYFFDGGYCGVQPVPSNNGLLLNACAMVRAGVATSLEQVFGRHPQLWRRSRDWEQQTETLAVSPLIFRRPQPVRGLILCAGDAAGFIDPFVGDGISLALRSGALAAECLANFFLGKTPLPSAVQSYGRNYEELFLTSFRASARLRRVAGSRWRSALMPFLKLRPVSNYVLRKTRGE